MKKKILYYLPSIIFNVAETLAIILIGVLLLKLDILDVIVIILVFAIIRMLTRSAMHYKSWKLCLIWSCMQISFLFLTAKVNFTNGII